MSELDKLISELAATARNTREAVRKAKEETGKEAAGCFLGFGPEELADAVDYQQQGVVYRYTAKGEPVDEFHVGVAPGAFCWK